MAASGACLLVMVAGCASPAARHDELAARLGLTRSVVQGTDYEHIVYAPASREGNALHVYLDGDGTPWLHGRWPAGDPSPREPLGLALAGRDPHGVYLGRPCYFGAGGRGGCDASLWTDARYGEVVVESMASAVRALREARRPGRLLLVGYSGGGTLAMLVAERVPGVDAVLTIAANLDVAGWTHLHGYLPLDASLDPARRPPLARTIRQVHFAGEFDLNVPPSTVSGVARRQAGSRFVVVPGFDHRCCWVQAWPELMQKALGGGPW